MDEHLDPPQMVIMPGPANAMDEWTAPLLNAHRPGRMVFRIPADAEGLPEALENYQPEEDVTAWGCKGTECSAPISDKGELETQLT